MNISRSRALVAQKMREVFRYESSVFESCYDHNKLIYIHIPKCAGTSVCSVLYGRSPWHWKAYELRFINRTKFEQYERVSIVRDPYARLYSTYRYASVDASKFTGSPLSFILEYDSFEGFVNQGLDRKVVRDHYFLASQSSYLVIKGELAVQFVGRCEDLGAFADQLGSRYEKLREGIPRLNVSTQGGTVADQYTSRMARRVADLYAEDFERFGYLRSNVLDG